ncbi:TPA: UDP-forming cellulose synthase catalytic subunit [Burkholderia multivorans]|uniref:UDP-forming cellulose synthase catalytic subunit n=1 Tax=Burkholderia multivorans TaxID=87883 RepID=UPI000CFE56EF|nr:UDP-forming cellulose synthase catalytic subunit [Burkholderia multivorans]MBU9297028.1 UDP-forming cellulose synthase catalytic subunit [Burkholderia multivorans]MBU9306972.1 UDP-forming cellulose synthase catalytic subunit [Burkholderia multivorans]MBU9409435.1 UDP-forming cellulose synthase catalytic subunit [Burkholderia multivorans]MBU9504592.1 UDP-forming cellulose synthase catalytic subunit [Burkholderia multivorans]MBU9506443.1 UDP-forming cellulose synthase catalytic subunit [Burkh
MKAALVARLRAARRGTTAWIARGLGLPAQRTLLDWLVRLFFHAPPPGRPDVVRRGVRAVFLRLAREWGVLQPLSPREWLWRACVRAPRAADAERPARDPLAWFDTYVVPVYVAARALMRRIDAALARLPWTRWGGWLDARANGVGRRRWLAPLLLLAGALLWAAAGMSPLMPGAQFAFFAIVALLALALRRVPGHLPTLALASLALLAAVRYVWWRTTQTLDFRGPAEAIAGYLLYGAEAYTWMILLLGFVQTAWPLDRPIVPLPADPDTWPSVDIYIPTYNEPLSVVKPTVFAAQSVDWPTDKLRVYLLDDGRRPEFAAFARDAGIGYLTRDDNLHAKAGNINRALPKTHGEYIAIFDCDHVPTRSFLQTTMGEFLRDPKCALVQTPHHFFSPDPFERNLGTFREVPNEGNLFYGLVQSGNDLWNAAFFCGSCAVLKRSALEEVGGVAVETVTEDAHTALKLHRRGYTSAYLPTVQAAGLATESLAGHVKQRTRWARGMAQISRIDNPFLGRGLGFVQRICYGNAMLHFFYGIPRLVFLTIPFAYLFFHLYFINASALALASYVIPYLVLANVANSRMQGRFRHSFWAEVYESVLAWYIALPTTVAFLSPKHGKFNVTDKGGRIDEGYVDWSTSKPYLVLLALNALAIAAGLWRLVAEQGDEATTILITLGWTVYNLAMLGAALAVARETKQVRVTHRIAMRVPATLLLADGTTAACFTSDYSTGGLGLDAVPGLPLAVGDRLQVCVSRGDRSFPFPVRVSRVTATHVGVSFDALTLEQERLLIQCTFGRADAWLDWHDGAPADTPLRGLKEVLRVGLDGYVRLWKGTAQRLQALLAPKLERARD